MNVILPLLFWAMAELPASADVAPVPVAGVVVDASGRPAQNAEVWLTHGPIRGRADRPGPFRGMPLSGMTKAPSRFAREPMSKGDSGSRYRPRSRPGPTRSPWQCGRFMARRR